MKFVILLLYIASFIAMCHSVPPSRQDKYDVDWMILGVALFAISFALLSIYTNIHK